MEKVTSTLLAILIALILLVIGVHFLPFDEAILSSIRSMLTTTSTIVFFLFLLTFIGSSIHDQLISPPERTVLMLEPNHLGDIESTKGAAPIFIKLPIHGIIGGPDLSMDLIDSFLTDTFGPILPKEQIRGVILHIDSPGGTDIDSAGIYKLISELKERFKIPVHAYIEGLCASGGLYVACSADRISASKVSKIGSIGVIMGPLLNFTDGMKKLGISSRTLSQGRGKDLFNPFRKWEKDEGKSIQKIIDALYEEFAAIVSTSRKVSKKKIEQMGADLFMATEAQTLGLIDASSSSYSQALLGLITAAGLKESDSYQVMSVSRPRQFLEEMIAGFSLKSSPLGVKDLLKMDPATKSQFLFLYR